MNATTMISVDYLYTTILPNISSLTLEKNSTYYYSHDIEDRSHAIDALIAGTPSSAGVNFVKVMPSGNDKLLDTNSGNTFKLRSESSMLAFLNSYNAATIYIYITGIDKRIIAALLNNSIKAIGKTGISEVRTVYAEPESYEIKKFQLEGFFQDLSEQIDGISPLPGFASIFPDDLENVLFIPLLGFEGGRFTYVLEHVQLPEKNVIPIIGVPGFRLEYPFIAYWGNKTPLINTQSWRKIKYASANSLVDAYMLLTSILNKNRDQKIKLAPIGTKPHLLAAILFAIKYPKQVELIYDNPKRQQIRTIKIGRIIQCSVSRLLLER
ncbi:MAG: hypothetical protein RIF39_00040 [Cyclobacteriaceae bacterium]